MSVFTKLAASIFAPQDAGGTPRGVVNGEAQTWGTELERIIDAAVAAGNFLLYETKAALDADLAHDANTAALVVGDSTSNDGLYVKSGASGAGSWSRVGDVPGYSFIRASDAGGSANAIAATTALPINESQLIVLPINITNDGTPVTVSFNGGGALTIKTAAGNNPAIGGLVSGTVVAGYKDGSTFQMLSDQASTAIAAQAAAEAAQAAAEAAASSVTSVMATIAQAQADTPGSDPEYYQIAFYDTNYVSNSGATYRKQASEPAHDGKFQNGNGTWYGLYERVVTPQMFGARADGVSGTDGAITASDATFTSAGAAFTSADIGKAINVEGAGAAGAQLSTTIASINSATSVELTVAASTTVSTATYAYGTDDKAAFKSLADFIERGGAKKGRFPAGSYLCNFTSASGDRFDINNADGWEVEGDGLDVTSVIQCGTSARPFTLRNSNNIAFRGVELLMTYEGGPADNLDVMNCNQATVEKNRFKNGTFYGLGAFQDTFDAIDGTVNDLTVRFNEFEGSGVFGFENFPKVKSYGLRCHDNVFRECGRNHIAIPGQDPAAMKPVAAMENARVYNNVIYGAAGAGGIWLGSYEDFECYNNELYDVPDVAIAVNAGTHPSYTGAYRSAIVRDNLLKTSSGFSRSEASISVGADAPAAASMGPVIVANNKIIGDTVTFSLDVQTVAAIPKLQIIDNYWESSQATFVPIRLDNSSGAAPSRPLIKGNRFINRNLSATAFRIDLNGAASPVIEDNYFANAGANAIALALCTGVVSVLNNTIDGYNVANASSVAAINVNDNVANEYHIIGNRVLTGQGNPKAIFNGTHADPTVYMDGNLSDDVSVLQVLTSTPTIYAGGAQAFANYGRWRHLYGTAAPASGGPYERGDIVWNTAPSASGTAAWVCTAAGSPGTWKAFGTIAA